MLQYDLCQRCLNEKANNTTDDTNTDFRSNRDREDKVKVQAD